MTTEDPPILVPSGLPDAVTRAWVALLRTIGDALREDAFREEGKGRETRSRVSRSIGALVPHDDFAIGRVEPERGIIWLRPTDDHHDDELPGAAVPVEDPVVARVLDEGLPTHEPLRLVVPLRLGRQLMGVVEIRHGPPWAYTDDHLAAASLIGEQLGPMIELMFQNKRQELARKQLPAF